MYKGLWMRRIGKLFFLFSVLFALEMGAFGAVHIGHESEALRAFAGQSFVLAAFALFVGGLGVFVMSELALRYEERDKKAQEARIMQGEDGLPGEFCAQIRGYNEAQLRLILDEQTDLYNEAELTFIKKVLAEKERRV